MADNENEGEGTSRGNEWEVVSLTASTYAAAPGPKEVESTGDEKDFNRTEMESSQDMFMSHHFVFPPSQHENLLLDPDISEIDNEAGGEGEDSTQVCGLDLNEGDTPKKSGEEIWNIKELSEVDEKHGIQFFDDKGKGLSSVGERFEEGKNLQGLDFLGEHGLYSDGKFSSIHAETDISRSTAYDEIAVIPEDKDLPLVNFDSPSDSSKSHDKLEENKSDLPCEAWWKRQATSLYSQAKEANAFWSVVVAATLMGLVILGQRWQQEKWQLQQLKWQFTIGNENINRVAGPISRFKDVLVGVQRRGPAIQGSASVER